MSSIVFEESVKIATECILQEKIILYPTDTVWGIGCDATKELCIQKIFNIKNRPLYKSVILLVSDFEQLHKYVNVNSFILDFLSQQNKPTTVIYPTTKIPLATSVYATDGSVAIRIVQDRFCGELIKSIKVPLVSTSANISSRPSPLFFQEIDASIKKSVDWIAPQVLEQGTSMLPSQIVRFTYAGQIIWIRK